ncbi:MAG TPA: SMP-30/gluconolactonase/LRE family protein [Chloroflexota bacterium]|nr:SMP-30/gluconolactonase/LRE family protein [Chloroflexota bacterium]
MQLLNTAADYARTAATYARDPRGILRRFVEAAPALDVRDPALRSLVSPEASVEQIAGGLGFTEGPLWLGDHLLFSDLPFNRIVRWQETPAGVELTTFRYPSGGALDDPRPLRQPGSNGLTLDQERRLVACEHGNRRVSRTEAGGQVVTLADRYDGKRLNSPNDVVVRSDGVVFFSDPPYGLPAGEEGKEQDANGVYRVEPDGRVVRLVADFDRPNGLAFSPDERTIYIADTSRRHLRAFDVTPEGDLVNGRLFADMRHPEHGGPDGMKVDTQGHIYCTGAAGVWVFTPQGHLLGIIRTPARPANCAFGGPDWQTLVITAQRSVYRIRVQVPGIPVPSGPRRT